MAITSCFGQGRAWGAWDGSRASISTGHDVLGEFSFFFSSFFPFLSCFLASLVVSSRVLLFYCFIVPFFFCVSCLVGCVVWVRVLGSGWCARVNVSVFPPFFSLSLSLAWAIHTSLEASGICRFVSHCS